MAAPNSQELSDWMGRRVNGADGEKIGKVDDIYLDDATGQPEWLAVTTGWFGTHVSFVPLSTARFEGDDVVIPYDKDTVKGSPHAERDGHLSPDDERRLYEHYRIEYAEASTAEASTTGYEGRADERGRSTDDAMTRSEEELDVSTTSRPSGRVRLRKWVDTEDVSRTVPVTHEEVRVEREPITEGNVDEAMSGPEISEGEHTEVLHEEEVVTNKRVVPKERVRLEKDTVTEEESVEADLRKEHISVEGDQAGRRGS